MGYLGWQLTLKQQAVMNSLAHEGSAMSAVTCNESGKTRRVIAGLILWHMTMFPKGNVVSTSGSWRQVTNQLVPALMAEQHKFPRWKFQTDGIRTEDGIERWIGFSTSDAGRFEGFHGDTPAAPLLITADEAKTIKDPIFEAIDRCHANRLGLLSSPGLCSGGFYRSQTTQAASFQRFKVTASECPWLSAEYIAGVREKWKGNPAYVASRLDAEFTETDPAMVMNVADIDRCIHSPPGFNQSTEVKAFCDFAAGGDENVLAVRRGNRITIEDAWRDKNTMSAVGRFIIAFRKHGLRPDEIEGDDDGLGHVMIDRLAEAGWPIQRFNGGAGPIFESACFNRTSEVWNDGAQAVQAVAIILPDDDDMRAQMMSRKRKFHSNGKIWIETKKEMAARGLPSPDRADAVLGCRMPPLMVKPRNLIQQVEEDGDGEWMDRIGVGRDAAVFGGFQV